ncbi:hypothetical protein DFJ58DRAFT_461098 [Suillus subalutaceus]|uniref:uncharacterized protein n=1 Tax=Suillus subalutaceus TaxID=48586 RepID=UPI001B874244|nr:uncharacterized protein DFJ58DRAFT_461098 [Suillus subalutaceus]KAG1848933.1 hypothetical protein DFJ58DRAFT_461098 [Suillus subalutaceus]
MTSTEYLDLRELDACLFDVFVDFAEEWRAGYCAHVILSLPPHNRAMVAAHRFHLIAASSVGFKTMYVPRPTEDSREVRESMRSKKDGGEVGLVVKDFEELARLICEARQS